MLDRLDLGLYRLFGLYRQWKFFVNFLPEYVSVSECDDDDDDDDDDDA